MSNQEDFSISIGDRVLKTELDPDGKIPVISANVNLPFGYVDKTNLKDFDVDSIVWGIDGDWNVRLIKKGNSFYPTDHCGVLRVKTKEVNPLYLSYVIFEKGNELRFSRTFRASIDRLSALEFSLPSKKKQDEIANKIDEINSKIESEIAKGNDVLKERDKYVISSIVA